LLVRAILHAHPVHGESHIQRNANREVATTSPPFYNELHRLHVLFVKAAPGMTFTSWSEHHFVVIEKLEWQVREASHCGSKQQSIEIMHRNHSISIIACSCSIYTWVSYFTHIPFFVVYRTFNTTLMERLQQNLYCAAAILNSSDLVLLKF